MNSRRLCRNWSRESKTLLLSIFTKIYTAVYEKVLFTINLLVLHISSRHFRDVLFVSPDLMQSQRVFFFFFFLLNKWLFLLNFLGAEFIGAVLLSK